ncbi:MAG: TonB-dependent receptor [Halieaceae bacterium]|jgi:iron complex outermembrane receptor protein|nr:TonB-dependent receptor [Halieaceae bacterium]
MNIKQGLLLAGAALAAPLTLAQGELEELLVTAEPDTRRIDVTEALSVSPDPAQLLHAAPGANVTRNGPITGIPQYRGLFGPRIAVALDGNQLAPAGPNWMDPPLSYAVTAQLEVLEVYRGIAPVRVAQETLGGAIEARTRRMAFGSSEAFEVQGRVMGSGQSVNNGYQLDAELQAANERHRFRAAAMRQEGDDAEFASGRILPSAYERDRYDLGYGLRLGDHRLQVDFGRNATGEAGTPALPMDIDYFDGDLASLTYRWEPASDAGIEARVYASDLDHGMTNYHLRPAPMAPGMWRQNIATADNVGFRVEGWLDMDGGSWRLGVDGFSERHDSNVDNPNNPMFFVVNFNDAERDVYGVFLEHDRALGRAWDLELGARVNRVSSDAGMVNGTPAMMMPPAQALRDAFNAADREQSESNFDLLAKLNYRLSDTTRLHLGVAQKQRGPSYQERYLWLPLEATAGLADGQVYIGDIALDSERAHQLELGLDFANERLRLQPRVFLHRIDDYIQGTPLAADHPATRFVRMMNAANGTNRADPLGFSNVEARLYGVDMDWALRLSEHFALSGLVNYVRGERRDIDDDLYRIAPLNATLRLDYASGPWSASLEAQAYAAQDEVSATNREQTTPGYGLINLRASWQASPSLQFALGVDNLLDREYAPHLGGYNRVRNADVPLMARLPAPGANVFGRVLWTF